MLRRQAETPISTLGQGRAVKLKLPYRAGFTARVRRDENALSRGFVGEMNVKARTPTSLAILLGKSP